VAPGWDDATDALLEDWRRRAAAAKECHYRSATALRRAHAFLGVPVVVLTAVVGTSVFATLSDATISTGLRVAVGAISVGAAVLAGLQTFFRFAERAERHVIAADWYAALYRETSQVRAMPPSLRGAPKECLDRLRKEMSKIGQQAPEIPEGLWQAVSRRYDVSDVLDIRTS
jgi:hypothetical protein